MRLILQDFQISEPLIVRDAKRLPRKGIREILVRGTNWIGDAVMTLPALKAIRKTWPQAQISILAKPWVADVIENRAMLTGF